MTQFADSLFEEQTNPLDGAEEMILTPDISFNRTNRDELFVDAKGLYGNYRMMFMWDETMGALQFCCEYGIQITDGNRSLAAQTVLEINSNLWLGHFDLPPETLSPTFRYTQLFRGFQSSGADHIQDLIRIAVDECDRHYPAFLSLCQPTRPDQDELALALMPVAGRS